MKNKIISAISILTLSIYANANDAAAPGDSGALQNKNIFFTHEKKSIENIDLLKAQLANDTNFANLNFDITQTTQRQQTQNVSIAGYKSLGFSIGELGEINLEQGLVLELETELGKETTLKAFISDEGSTLAGSTREISDFDMMIIELENRYVTVRAGDMFENWHEDAILSGQKKIVGISANIRPFGNDRAFIQAFGSASGGNHVVQNIRGRASVQGPYYLTGRGEPVIITPVAGTVSVRVNGRELTEGASEDFIVDYNIGAITFNPRVPIGHDDFIRAEYEYKMFDYRRIFAGGGAAYQTRDTVFSFSATLWSESDNKNQPIELPLDDDIKDALRNSADGTAYSTSARAVHPLDVARVSVFHPLYKKVFDANANDTVLVYTPYDPLRPEDTRGFYTAHFTPAETGTFGADYVIDTTVNRGQFVYRFAGAGAGNFSALARVGAPARESAGEIGMRLRLRKLNAALNVAGKETDHNLFAERLNSSEYASAVTFKLNAGGKSFDRRTVWFDADYRYRSQNFTDEILSANDRRENWGANDIADNTQGHAMQSWEAAIGATVVRGAEISAGAGQNFIGGDAETEKITTASRIRFANARYGVDVDGAYFKHNLSDAENTVRKRARFIAKPTTFVNTFLEYRDEWINFSGENRGGTGTQTVGAEAQYLPYDLRQHVEYSQYLRGENLANSQDTGYAVTWNQEVAFSPISSWRLGANSSFRRVEIYDESVTSTFLMSAVSEVSETQNGFSSRLEYRVSSELASRFEQKMFFVGRGLGTHAFDSAANEFRPSVNGDHIIQEVEIYDNTDVGTVRKTFLAGDWYYRPARELSGILNDLTWSGYLSLEEHIDSRNRKIETYFPGAITLFYDNRRANYADLSYRQDVEHHVHGSDYKTRLYFNAGLRIVRDHEEPTYRTGVLIERKKNSLTLSVEPQYLSVRRLSTNHLTTNSTNVIYDLRDVGAEFVQSFNVGENLELYLRERTGRIFDEAPDRAASLPFDESAYFQVRPGMIYRVRGGGRAELSYTFSHVSFAGAHDYRIAGGSPRGTGHVINFTGDINAGRVFNFSAMYRGECVRPLGETNYLPFTHVFSAMVKAFF